MIQKYCICIFLMAVYNCVAVFILEHPPTVTKMLFKRQLDKMETTKAKCKKWLPVAFIYTHKRQVIVL